MCSRHEQPLHTMATLPCLIVLLACGICWGHPLEDYVTRPDASYQYSEVSRAYNESVTIIIVNMTSQTWKDDTFTDQPVWFHYLIIALPDDVRIPDQSFVFVGLGEHTDGPPDPDNNIFVPLMRDFALETGAAAAWVTNVPMQPTSFPQTGHVNLTEDALISRTWRLFLDQEEPRDPDILLYFPMTKAIVRAMDTVASVATDESTAFSIDKFVVGGPSKRGWTAWLTAEVDKRVVGLVPMVLSLLNMIPNLHHHYRSLGGWSWAFEDYWNEGLTEQLDDPEVLTLTALQDPYEMRENLTMPIYYIKAANDEFFMFDDLQFFYDDLTASPSKNILILDNAVHIMLPHWDRLLASVASWFINVHQNNDRVFLTWDRHSNPSVGSTTITLLEDAVNVTAWTAVTVDNTRRDFRWLRQNEAGNGTEESHVEWFETAPENLGGNQWRLTVNAPANGTWVGFYLVATFDGPEAGKFIEISSPPNVVPNTFFFDDCVGAGCTGEIV